MHIAGALLIVALTLTHAGDAWADEYENQCVAVASEKLPGRAELIRVETSAAQKALVDRYQKDASLRWVKVKFFLKIADRSFSQSLLCAFTKGNVWHASYVSD